MSFTPESVHLRIATILLAALIAVLGVALAAAPAASAGGGGVGTGGGGGGGSANQDKYSKMWDSFSENQQRWANKTAKCESGKDPNAVDSSGKYRGAFQFLKSTWKSSPKSPGGDPIDYNYKTQAVVAIKLKQRDGAGHWPVCG